MNLSKCMGYFYDHILAVRLWDMRIKVKKLGPMILEQWLLTMKDRTGALDTSY